MSSESSEMSPTNGPVTKTFFSFVIPSTLSLLAISTASIVDGFFVGNYVGTEALAAVNLMMPFIALLFGLALMLAVGGSVKVGIAIGRGELRAASSIFSQVFTTVLGFNLLVIPLSLNFSDSLFQLLGADPSVWGLMWDYYSILSAAMVVQLSGLVLYYFFRADNRPQLGMHALLIGAGCNIGLDYLFIYHFDWGLEGAGWATLVAQFVQLAYMLRYFLDEKRNLYWSLPNWKFRTLTSSAFNGFSEFINEISIGLVVLVFHWLITMHSGTQGIAAFSVINYLIFISLMIYYGIVDAMHVLISQNFGARDKGRVTKFMHNAISCIAILSVVQVSIIYLFQDALIHFFLDSQVVQAKSLTEDYMQLIWPIFIFNGFNVLTCAYLTSIERAFYSSVIALLRSFILPITLALTFYFMLGGECFISALAWAEGITFVVALIFYHFNQPNKTITLTPNFS